MDKKYIGVGVSLGLGFGIVLGAAMHNLVFGIALGLPFGAAIGVVMSARRAKIEI